MEPSDELRFRASVRARDLLARWANRLPVHDDEYDDRILAVTYGGLGDTLLCETFFWRLKQERPTRRIDVLTGSARDLVAAMPTVDTVLVLSLRSPFQNLHPIRRCLESINRRRYAEADEVLGMAPLNGLAPAFSGLALLASKAPIRIGRHAAGDAILERSDRSLLRAPAPIPCITHAFSPGDPAERAHHESLDTRACLGFPYQPHSDRPLLCQPDGLPAWWAERMISRLRSCGHRLVVGVHLDVTYPLKAWPEERFLEVIRRGAADGMCFVLVGRPRSPNGCDFPGSFPEEVLDVRGKTDLPHLMALISKCDLFLSADTGPAHVAQALQVPTVVLFGPSNHLEFGPRQLARHRCILATRPCGTRPCVMGPCVLATGCMTSISVDTVHGTLQELAEALRHGAIAPRRCPSKRPITIEVFG